MKKSYVILILLGILTTIFLSFASFISFQNLLKGLSKIHELRDQKEALIVLFSDIKDAETGQRGYIITGMEDYLEPYYNSLQITDKHLLDIQRELSVTPRGKLLIHELTDLIKLKLSHLNDTINTRRNEGFEPAQRKVSAMFGKQYMDSIRDVMEQLINEQSHQLEINEEKIQGLIERSFLFNLLGGTISSLLITLFSFLFYRDSIELGAVKKQFRQTNDLYQAILDSAKQMIITTDTKGLTTSFNKAAEKTLGFKADEVKSRLSILNFFDSKELKKKAEELTEKTKHLQYSEFDALVAPSRYFLWIDTQWPMRKKNGMLFPCSQSITVLRNESNTITGYLFICSDVTESKKWEKELQETQQAIEKAQVSKNQFLNSLNHELKTPLNTMINFANLLMKNVGGNLTDLEMTYAHRIKDIGQSMLSLVNEILDISRKVESLPQLKLTKTKLDIFFKQIIDQMDKIPDLEFVLDIPKETKFLETDSEKFSSLIHHLIKYAIANYRGQILIQAKIEPKTFQSIEIDFIQNTYHPIIPTKKEGNDLIIAQTLAHQLHYQILEISTPGKGDVYRLLLSKEKSTGGNIQDEQENEKKIYRDPKMGFKNLNVLIIDDDPEFRSLLTAYLEDLGCQVIPATSGSEVIQLAKSQPIDLITMDMLMSPMNGYDVVQELQSDPNLRNIPFAFISIIAKEIKNKIPGALAFINKPITRDDLTHLLQMCQAQRKLV